MKQKIIYIDETGDDFENTKNTFILYMQLKHNRNVNFLV